MHRSPEDDFYDDHRAHPCLLGLAARSKLEIVVEQWLRFHPLDSRTPVTSICVKAAEIRHIFSQIKPTKLGNLTDRRIDRVSYDFPTFELLRLSIDGEVKAPRYVGHCISETFD
jgi:hypothetical protein